MSARDGTIDADALRERYRAEREKRLRADGSAQYVEVAGRFAHFVDDPYVEPGFTRAPLTDEVDVALIGGGFGGLLAGARLKQAGVTSVRIVEKGGDVGGTWYWNRYPGAACDIESYVYLPMLEELGYVPKEKYSRAPEIFAYCRRIAEKFDLYRDALLQTEVTSLDWDPSRARWIVRTNRNDAFAARFVALANGFLQRPKLPGIPGIETFRGHTFHTSRWDSRTPAATPKAGSSSLRTSASASSARERPPCSACRTSVRARRSCSSSSARPRRSACARTARRIRSGPRPSSPAGTRSGWTTSRC